LSGQDLYKSEEEMSIEAEFETMRASDRAMARESASQLSELTACRRAGCSRKTQLAHAGEPPVKLPTPKPRPDRIDTDKRRWYPGARVR
jgi:hypothetical protein